MINSGQKKAFGEIRWHKPKTVEERNEIILGSLEIMGKIIAKNFIYNSKCVLRPHISREDLFQEGIFTVIDAINNFDPVSHHSTITFSGYLGYCLKKNLNRYLLANNRIATLRISGRSYKKRFWIDESETFLYFSDLNDKKGKGSGTRSCSLTVNNKIFHEWLASEYVCESGEATAVYIESVIKLAGLSDKEIKILKAYFEFDGLKMKINELARRFGNDRTTISKSIDKSLMKLRAVNNQNSDIFNNIAEIKKEILTFFKKAGLLDREISFLEHYYGLNNAGKILMLEEIGKKYNNLHKQIVWRIINDARKKIFFSNEVEFQPLIDKARKEILFLIGGLNINLLHCNALKDFYCLTADRIIVRSSPRHAQAKFKSSLAEVVGLAEFSRYWAKMKDGDYKKTSKIKEEV